MRPLLIYDGDCNFCRRWIVRWEHLTGDHVDYAPYQRVASRYPYIPRENFEKSVQLIDVSGQVFSGAEAVFRTLAYAGHRRGLRVYQNIPGAKWLCEAAYRLVANHRMAFSFLTRLLWGDDLAPARYTFSRWIFLKALGVIYLIAFLSLSVQILGLAGAEGILPAGPFLKAVGHNYGVRAYHLLPTLCWFNSSDGFLIFLCAGGSLLSLCLILGLAPVPVLALLWTFYLSLTVICRDFLSFQWDILLLEAGFLAIFFAPFGFLPKPGPAKPPVTVLWLFRWLLFRLMFASGAVKLASGDPAWRHLTALVFHYETQPLPPWTAWYMHHLPAWFHQISAAGVFLVELAVPFLIFAPKRIRAGAGIVLAGFQLLIIITGNYCFFNWLTIALCFLLFDDGQWPVSLRDKVFKKNAAASKSSRHSGEWPGWATLPLAAVILLLSVTQGNRMFRRHVDWPAPVAAVRDMLSPFCLVNSYGLFAVMTTSRPEIIVEGSMDGRDWTPYEFRYKPGDPSRRPGFVAPHQPRLDWQMWFAALGTYRENPWFLNFCIRLLQGSPDVLRLLKTNPFPQGPPKYIRAVVYDYHFTDPATRSKTGEWWRREKKDFYCPPFSLRANPV